jgi:glycosyltransferase involved in cell wall biosynthesis
VTPNFNHAACLPRCVDSVANQSWPVLEHVVVDDASTDDSAAILEKLAESNPRLKVILSERNQGVSLAVAKAIEAAKGDFVIALASDDELPRQSIEAFMKVIRDHPDAAYICGEVEYVRGTNVTRRRYITADLPVYLPPDQLAKYQRSMLTVVNGAAVVRRELVHRSALCDPGLRWVGDKISYTVIAYRYGLWYVPEVVHRFQLSDTNMSRKARVWKWQKPVLDRVFELLGSEEYADVVPHYRASAALSEMSFILRYMLPRPATWRLLTPRLVVNATVFYCYRKARDLFPQRLVETYVNARSSRAAERKA